MIESFVSNVSNLRVFIIVSVAMLLVIGVFLLICCHKFTWEGKKQKWIGFFYHLKWSDTIGLAVSLIKFSLFLSILFTAGNAKLIHIAAYVILHVLYIIFRRNLKGLPLDFVMGAVSCGLLGVMNMLQSYLTDVVFNAKIQIVLVLLSILLVVYGLIDVFLFCRSILERGMSRKKRLLANEGNKEGDK